MTPAGLRGDRLSLRARLVAVLLVLLALALLASGTATLAVLRDDLMRRTDQQLEVGAQWRVLSGLVNDRGAQGADRGPSQYDLTVLDAEGNPLRHVSGTGRHDGGAPDVEGMSLAQVERLGGRPITVEGQDGSRQWRVVMVSAAAVDGSPVSVAVALPLDDVRGTLALLRTRLVLIGLVVLTACALLGLAAVRRAFRPLREIETVTSAFGEGDMSRRVPVAAPGTEVGRLGAAVNAMLDSIQSTLAAREASEGRMRRFVADASHELRTPVAAVRGFAELYRMGAVRDPQDVARSFRRIEDESARMGGLVEDLLLLARLDEQRPLRRDPVDLLVIAGDAVHDAAALAPGRAVRLVGLDGDPSPRSARVLGDDARLRQVMTNLLTNALRHTPPDTSVEIGVGAVGGWARWQVVDHGPGIAVEDAERVFERFHRADGSRSRGAGGGAGLGLAIVAAISRAHGGAVRVVPTPGGGATFEVALPLLQRTGEEEASPTVTRETSEPEGRPR